MAFKELQKLKKISVREKETFHTKYVVIGHDLYAIDLYKNLVRMHGLEYVKFLSMEKFTPQDFIKKGPSHVRGQKNIEFFENFFPHGIQNKFLKSSMYLKEKEWKTFGGRGKSEALKYHEEFFVEGHVQLNYAELFPFINDPDEIQKLNDEVYPIKIESIDFQNNQFSIMCVNGSEFITDHLYFGLSPFLFLNLFKNKAHLNYNLMEYFESLKSPSVLYLNFQLKKSISEMQQSFFIPLSYTHEWGHFICEFWNSPSGQELKVLHFLDKEQTTEDDISRIIRMLKKQLEKNFPEFKQSLISEFIVIEEFGLAPKIDDQQYTHSLIGLEQFAKNLEFFGANAPLHKRSEDEIQKIFPQFDIRDLNFDARALMTLKLLYLS